MFESIQTTTAPLEPIQEILRYPLPGLTDLSHVVGGGDITLLDLADVVAPYTGYGPLWDLIHSVGDLVYAIDQIELGDSVRLPLGGFNLNNYDLRGIVPAGDVQDLNLASITDLSIDNLRGWARPLTRSSPI